MFRQSQIPIICPQLSNDNRVISSDDDRSFFSSDGEESDAEDDLYSLEDIPDVDEFIPVEE